MSKLILGPFYFGHENTKVAKERLFPLYCAEPSQTPVPAPSINGPQVLWGAEVGKGPVETAFLFTALFE